MLVCDNVFLNHVLICWLLGYRVGVRYNGDRTWCIVEDLKEHQVGEREGGREGVGEREGGREGGWERGREGGHGGGREGKRRDGWGRE